MFYILISFSTSKICIELSLYTIILKELFSPLKSNIHPIHTHTQYRCTLFHNLEMLYESENTSSIIKLHSMN